MTKLKAEIRNLRDFVPATLNPNKGNPNSIPLIQASIHQNGAGRPMLADRDGEMIAGSHALQGFIDAGYDEAIVIEGDGNRPVIFVRQDIDIDSPQGRSLQVGDNVITLQSYTPDDSLIAALLTQIGAEDAKFVQAAGFDDTAVRALMARLTPTAKEDPGAQVDRAGELQQKWGVERGELFLIGKHKLLCGDSTNAADMARLMNGECAEMIWTDPPYGVSVGDKNRFLNSIAPANRIEENLENDTLDEPELVAMLKSAFDNAMAHCLAGGAWYVAAPPGPLHVLFGQCLKDRGIWRQTIQWVKNNATFAPLGVDYHWRCEPIFYGWLPGAGHRYYGGRQQDTVWEIDRPMASPEHPTMKPVELVARAVQNSSLSNEIVYDPFLGSGTTLVACEQLGRQGRGIEISEKYCAVILERMSGLGLEPKRVTNGRP